MSYLGRKLNLWGTTVLDVISCEELLCEAMDLRNLVVAFSYGRSGNPADAQQTQAFLAAQTEGILAKLDLWLSRQSKFSPETPFFVSGYATAPDFHVFELLDQLQLLAKHQAQAPPTGPNLLPYVNSFYLHFKQLPGNEKYLMSKMADAPCNNLSAVFGSLSAGRQWEKGLPLPVDITGVY